ncbi:MAG TPA: hypothetical protein VK833_04525, partial [Gillisia sp.]|nr:hypothetical protein [Gillisia sp.]
MKFFTLGSKRTTSDNTCYSGTVLNPTALKTRNRFNIGSLLVLMIFGLAMLMPSNMQAQHPYGFIDGDVLTATPPFPDPAFNQLDWEDVWKAQQTPPTASLPGGSITTGIILNGKVPDTIFTGGGTKDHLPINGPNASKSWQWKTAEFSSSDKTNIQETGAILIDGKIYFFANKFAAEGTTTIGFWFFQDIVAPIAGGRFSGEHQIGDVFVLADIVQGGAVGIINAYQYVGEDNGGDAPNSNKVLKTIVVDGTTLAATVNTLAQPTPWPHQSKNVAANIMPPVTFIEGFIDIEELDLNINACFSSFHAETRSSSSVSSILEDFAQGAFNVQPIVSVDDETACESDTPVTLTAVVEGGIPPITFVWKKGGVVIPGETTETLEVSESGSYSVIAQGKGINGNGGGVCESEEAFATVTINDSPAPSVDDEAECEGDTATFMTADLGTGFTYQWYLDDVLIGGATSNSYTPSALALADSGGVYKVVVTDTNN